MADHFFQIFEPTIVHVRICIAEVAKAWYLKAKAVFGVLTDPVTSKIHELGVRRQSIANESPGSEQGFCMAAVAVLKKKGVAFLLLLIELTVPSFYPIVFGLIGDKAELELSQRMQQSLRVYGRISKGFAKMVPVAPIPSEFSENVWQRIAHFAGMGHRGECLIIE